MIESHSAPLAEQEWVTAEGTSSGRWARDPDPRSDQRTGFPRQLSIESAYSFGRKEAQVASNRPPLGKRIFRAVTRFLIAVLIGVGATLAWQSYGDAATEMMAAHVPMLAWLLPVSTTKPAVAAVSPDPAQQLAPLASNLDAVRRTVEQLAAKQDRMVQNIALLRAVDEDVREKMFATPPSPVEQAASNTQPRAQQSRTQPLSAPRATSPAGAVPR